MAFLPDSQSICFPELLTCASACVLPCSSVFSHEVPRCSVVWLFSLDALACAKIGPVSVFGNKLYRLPLGPSLTTHVSIKYPPCVPCSRHVQVCSIHCSNSQLLTDSPLEQECVNYCRGLSASLAKSSF